MGFWDPVSSWVSGTPCHHGFWSGSPPASRVLPSPPPYPKKTPRCLPPMSSPPSTDPRLPLSVLPLHYDLTIVPDFTTFRFTGVVQIQLEVTQETQTILLNVNELEIQQVSFPEVVSENNLLDSFRVDPQSQRLIIQLSEPVEKTALLTLEIHFTGAINDSNAGFYRCEYLDRQGTQRYGGVTQFESTDARKALPCFDEPGFKSTFQVTITAPQGLHGPQQHAGADGAIRWSLQDRDVHL